MLTVSLSVLKYALMLIGAGLGVYGITHDYKRDGRLTKAGRIAIGAMIVVATLTIVTAGLEQYASSNEERERLLKERLGHPLSDLTLSWQISQSEATTFANQLQRARFEMHNLDPDGSFKYIETAVLNGGLAVRRSITGWGLDLSLQRPMGMVDRRFGESTPEWAAFGRAIQKVIGDRFELSLTNGKSILDLGGSSALTELTIENSSLTFHVLAPDLSPLDLQQWPIVLTQRGDFQPKLLRVTTSDQRVTIDETVPLHWNESLWKAAEATAYEQPIYEYHSDPIPIRVAIIEGKKSR